MKYIKRIGFITGLVCVLACMMFVSKFSQPHIYPQAVAIADDFAGGTGVSRNPYQITNESEFLLFKNTPSNKDQYFILTNDIEVTSPLGDGTNGTINMYNDFYGNFDGGNYKITYNNSNRLSGNNAGGICGSLVATVTETGPNQDGDYTAVVTCGVIKNVTVVGNFTTSGNNIGGIVGKIDYDIFTPNYNYLRVQVNASTLENVNYQGSIAGNDYVGGIVGSFNAPSFDLADHQILEYFLNIHNAFKRLGVTVDSSVTGRNNVGGLIGAIVQEEVTASSSSPDYYFQDITYNAPNITFNTTGKVEATGDYVGGVIGNYQRPGIKNTPVSDNGSITINKTYGRISSTIDQTFNILNGRSYVGGIAGFFSGFGISISDAFISNITTKIYGREIGGIFGSVDVNSYETLFTDPTIFATTINTVSSYVGGVVGIVSEGGYLRNVTGNVAINASGSNVGGATGQLGTNKKPAQMENIHLTGRISGNSSIGGLVGTATVSPLPTSSSFHMNNCTTALDVTGGSMVGGVIGNFDLADANPQIRINNVWMSGTVRADLNIAQNNNVLKRNYIYWGSFYGYQSKNTSLTPTNMFLTNSGSIIDVTLRGAHQAIEVYGILNNDFANRQIETISTENDTYIYRIKAMQGADLGFNNEMYGFISNYNGQLIRIQKNDNSYVYVSTLDRTETVFNTDLDIDLSQLTCYGSNTDFDIIENVDSNGQFLNYTVNISSALQLERLAFVLQYFIDDDGGLAISGPTDAGVNIVLQGNNVTYDLTTSKGYYGNNNFYGIGWSCFGPFLGDFNGNNNTIKLDMDFPNGFMIGLFGAISSNSGGISAVESTNDISNVTITGRIVGHSHVGSVVGFHDNYAPSLLDYDRKSTVRLSYIRNMATVDGINLVGGLLGYSNSSITNTAVDLDPSATRVYLIDCINYANVTSTGSHGTGGLIGATGWNIASSVAIQNCSNMGDVLSTGSYVGGFIGRASKQLILSGTNELYGNVAGKSFVGLVYGDIPSTISYGASNDAGGTSIVTVPNPIDLSTVTAYYYLALGDMSNDILGQSLMIDGILYTFESSDLFHVISWNYDKYARYDLNNWKISGVNTLNSNINLIGSYQGSFEKVAISLVIDPTTLRYELNIIKSMVYKAEDSVLEKVYDLTTDAYNQEWSIKAEITYFNNEVSIIDISYDQTTIDESSTSLEFTNIAVNDNRYNFSLDNLTLRRITKDIVTYEKACLGIANASGEAQKLKYLSALAQYDQLIAVYGSNNAYLNSYLARQNVSKNILDAWASIIVDEIIVSNSLSSVTYGTAYDQYLIKYKTIDGMTSSNTTQIVVSYRYVRNSQNLLVGTAYFNELVVGNSFYEATSNGLVASYPFTTETVILDDIVVDKATLSIELTNQTITYKDNFSGIVPTISGNVASDSITVDILYNLNSQIPSTAGTYNVSIAGISGTNSDYYEYNTPTCQLIINKIKVSVEFGSHEFIYNTNVQRPTVSVTSTSLLSSDDYTITETDSINAGNYTTSVTLNDSDNYEFITTSQCDYVINKINATAFLAKTMYLADVVSNSLIPSFTGLYESSPSYELVTRNDLNEIIANTIPLSSGTYHLEYKFTNYNVAIIEISVVDSISLNYATINLVTDTAPYDGSAHIIKAVITYDGDTLVEGVDYSIITLTDLINVGVYTDQILISGRGSYSGSITKSYEITKVTPVIEADAIQEFTYCGSGITPLASANIDDFPFIYLFEGINGTTYPASALAPVNAGEYRVTISAISSQNYEKPQDVIITMKINRANSIITGENIEVVYNGNPQKLSATLNHEEELSYHYVGVNYNSNLAPSDAGNYKVTVSVGETANYLAQTETYKLTIAKQTLNFTKVIDEFDYDGSVKTVLYTLPITGLNVTGNHTRTNATTGILYELVIDEKNYQGNYSGSFVINKVTPTYDIPSPVATYNDYLSSVTLPSGFAWNNPTERVGNVGDRQHPCTYTPSDTENYLIVSNILVDVKVKQATPQYTTPSVKGTYGDFLKDISLPSGFSWNKPNQSVGPVGSNSHLVTLTPTDPNYAIVSNIRVNVTVAKAPQTMLAIEAVEVTINSITVTNVPNATYRINGGTWSNSNTFTALQEDTLYTIEACLLGDSNYETSNIVMVVIKTLAKTKPTITNFDDVTFTYNPSNNTFTINPKSTSSGAITYSFVAGTPRDVISISGNTINVLKAGSVQITLNQAETNSFGAISKTVTITIAKAIPQYTLPSNLEATYGTKLKDLTLPSGFSFQGNLDATVGNVGTHTILGKFTPSDVTNYQVVEDLPLVVTVTKATPAVNPEYSGPTLYPSSPLPTLTLKSTDTPGIITLDAGQSLTAGTKSYTWSFTPTDYNNYLSATGQINLVAEAIALDHLEIITLPSKINYVAFEYFNPDGMVVSAVYNDGSSIIISNYQYDTAILLPSMTSVNITYDGKSIAQAITVAKRTLLFNNVVDHFVYDGTPKTVTYVIGDGMLSLKVEGNIVSTKPQTATNYTLTIVDENYQGTYSGTFLVDRAQPTYVIPNNIEATYLDKLSNVSLPSGFTWQSANDLVGNVGTNSHLATFTPQDLSLYYPVQNIPIRVKVNKAIPTFTIPSLTTSYGTILKDLALPSNFKWASPTAVVGNVGVQQHDLIYIPTDLQNYQEVTVSCQVQVTKASKDAPIINIITQTINSVTVTAISGVHYRIDGGLWSESNSFTSLVSGQTYTIEAYYLENDNYFASAITTIEVTISTKIQPAISNFGDLDLTYQADQTINLNPSSSSSGAITYELQNAAGIATINGNVVSIIKAGSFFIVLNQEETPTFTAASVIIRVTIAKAVPSYTLPINLEANYLDLVSSVALPTGFAFQNIEATTLVGNVGDNSFYVTYTPDNLDCYKIVSHQSVVIKVKPLLATASVSYTGGTIYASATELPVLTVDSSNTPGRAVLDATLPLVSGTRKYKYYFIPTDNNNYQTYEGYLLLTVERVNLIRLKIINLPNKLTYTAFETFDSTGLVVSGIYNDGSTKVIDDYDVIYLNGDSFKALDTYVSIYWQDQVGVNIDITVRKIDVTFSNVVDKYTYDGSSHSVTYELSQSGLSVTGVPSSTNATKVVYTLTVNDANYQGTHHGTFEIAKAKYTNITHPGLVGTFDETKKLSDYTLNPNFRWNNPNMLPTCDITSYLAYYNSDAINYEDYPLMINLTLGKKQLDFSNITSRFTYDGTPKSVLYQLPVANITVIGNPSITNATTGISYRLEIKDNNYQGYYVGELIIDKAAPLVEPSFDGALYPTSSLPILTLSASSTKGQIVIDDNQVLKVGTYQYTWTFTPTDELNYTSLTGSIALTVDKVELSRIVVTNNPTKLDYVAFDFFDNTGCVITAYYNDGSLQVVSDYRYQASVTVSNPSVTYEYTEDGITKTVKLTIKVTKKVPDVNPYYDGPTLYTSSLLPVIKKMSSDTAGLISLNNGQRLVAGTTDYNYTFTPTDSNNYQTYVGTISLTVLPVELTALTITNNPLQMIYDAFATFNPVGLEVEAKYNDGSCQIITNYQIDANLRFDNRTVKISYTENNITKTASFEVTVNKLQPVVNPFYSGATLYVTSALPTLSLRTNDTPGAAVLDPTNVLTVGTFEYTYTYTPIDAINYESTTGKISLTVLSLAISGLNITHMANKRAYIALETFDTTGLVVYAVNNDSSSTLITDYTIRYAQGDDRIHYGDTYVIITYAGMEVQHAITVSKASLQGLVNYQNKEVTYDGALHSLVLETLPLGVAVSDLEYTSNSGIFAGTYEATLTINAADYETYQTSGTLTITKRHLTISYTGETSLTYTGQNFLATMVRPVVNNLATTDQTSLNSLVNNVYYDGDQTIGRSEIINVGTYHLEVRLTEAGSRNYEISDSATMVEITILPATREVEIVLPSSLVYDKLPKALVSVKIKNTETLVTSYTVHYYDDTTELGDAPTSVGSYRVVVLSSDPNYELTNNERTYQITTREVEVNFGDLSSVYNGLQVLYQPTLVNVVSGDIVEAVFTIHQANNQAILQQAGSYQIMVNSLTGVDANNYYLAPLVRTYTIEKCPVTINSTILPYQYDGNTYTPTYSFVNGTSSISLEHTMTYYDMSSSTILPGVPVNVGTYRLVLSDFDTDNYEIETTINLDYQISPRPITVVYPDDLVYRGVNQDVPVIFNGVLAKDLSEFTYEVRSSTSGIMPNNKVLTAGKYNIVVSYTGNNYVINSSLTHELTVQQLSLRVELSLIKGEISYNGQALGGYLDEEIFTVETTSTTPFFGFLDYEIKYLQTNSQLIERNNIINVGSYQVMIECNNDPNLIVTTGANAIIKVTPASLSLYSTDGTGPQIAFTELTQIYQKRELVVKYQFSGLYGDDEIVPTIRYSAASGEVCTPINVGTYRVVVVSIDNSNYRLPTLGISVYLEIKPYVLEVVAQDVSTMYGDDIQTSLPYYNGTLFDGDEIRGTLRTVANKFIASTYLIERSPEFSVYDTDTNSINANYEIKYTSAIYTVTRRIIDVSLDVDHFIYDGNNHELQFGIDGALSGDTAIVSFKSYLVTIVDGNKVLTETSNNNGSGKYEIVLYLNPNYQLSLPDALTYEVTKATLDLSLAINTSVYNGQPVDYVVVNSQGKNVVITTRQISCDSKVVDKVQNAGTYTISVEVSDANYMGSANLQYVVEKARYRDIVHEDLYATYEKNLRLHQFDLEDDYFFITPDQTLSVQNDGMVCRLGYNVDQTNYFDYEFDIHVYIGKARVNDFELTPMSFVYDGLPHQYTLNTLPEGVTGVQYQNNTLTDAGIVNVVITFEVDVNYHPLTPRVVKLTVTRKPLIVTPISNQQKQYTDLDPVLDYEVIGLIGDDLLSGLLTRAPGENLGQYEITLGSLTATNNYEIVFTTGIYFEITSKYLNELSLVSNVLTYNTSIQEVALRNAGAALPDDITYLVLDDKVLKDAGTYQIRVVSNTPNYRVLDEDAILEVTINKLDISNQLYLANRTLTCTGMALEVIVLNNLALDLQIQKTYYQDLENGLDIVITEVIKSGDYFVDAVINDSNYQGSTRLNFTVVKANRTISYDANLGVIGSNSFSYNLANATLMYQVNNGTWVQTVGNLAGNTEYAISLYAEEDDIYHSSNIISFTIKTRSDLNQLIAEMKAMIPSDDTEAYIEKLSNELNSLDSSYDQNAVRQAQTELGKLRQANNNYRANKVVDLINQVAKDKSIPLDDIFKLYETLSDEQKSLVSNYDQLVKLQKKRNTPVLGIVLGVIGGVVLVGGITAFIIIKKKKR